MLHEYGLKQIFIIIPIVLLNCIVTGTMLFVWDLILKVRLTLHGYAQGKLRFLLVVLGICIFVIIPMHRTHWLQAYISKIGSKELNKLWLLVWGLLCIMLSN